MAMNLDKFIKNFGVERFRLLIEQESYRRRKAEGKIEGKQEALLTFLEARGLAVTARQRARILECSDLDVLGGWITKAAAVASTRELLGWEKAAGTRRTGQRVPPKRATTRGAAAKK